MRKGWKTSEFWVSLLTMVGMVGTALAGGLPSQYAAKCITVTAVAYALARGLAKFNVTDGQPPLSPSTPPDTQGDPTT